jgi:hypothetical protein
LVKVRHLRNEGTQVVSHATNVWLPGGAASPVTGEA